MQNILPSYDDEEDDNERKNTLANEPTSNTVTFGTSEQSSAMKLSPSATADNSTRLPKSQDGAANCKQTCECYAKLCLSVVSLIFQLLRQWLIHKKEYCKTAII